MKAVRTLILACLVGYLAGCASTAATAESGATQASDGAASALVADDLNGNPTTIALQNRDKPLLLVFWASWCEPCNHEAKAVESYYQQVKDLVELTGVNVDEKLEDALAFRIQYAVTYPSLADSGLAISDRFHIQATPTFLLFDRSGRELMRTKRLDDSLMQAVQNASANPAP